MLESPRVRTATPADADPLAVLAVRTFRDIFAVDNSTDEMEAYVRDSFSLDRIRAELADDPNTILLAFMDGDEHPDGYAKLRTCSTGPGVTGRDTVERPQHFVGRRAIAHGVGAALMQVSRDAARSAGHRTVRLGCGNATKPKTLANGASRRLRNDAGVTVPLLAAECPRRLRQVRPCFSLPPVSQTSLRGSSRPCLPRRRPSERPS